MNTLFPPPEPVLLRVANETRLFPVHHIYCIGRNYAEHAREMGAEIEPDAPVFFCKPAAAATQLPALPYPKATSELHHEVELVVALGKTPAPGSNEDPMSWVFGYGVGIDLTRRDLQAAAKSRRHPWDTAKAFDLSAPLSELVAVEHSGHPDAGAIELRVNGELRQQGDLADMIHGVGETLLALSRLFTLRAGDLVFMGTPAGVGALLPGDRLEASIASVGKLSLRIEPAATL